MANKDSDKNSGGKKNSDKKMNYEKESNIGITVKKEKDISEWYQEVVLKSGLADYSAVSGCIVFKPSSYAIWEKIQREVDCRLKKLGIQNVYFPLFIPESLLGKESTHIKGFKPEVAWVTEAGGTKLDERLAIRPTSETIMYDSFSKWIRSWRDLPLKFNQWNNVVRWEFKHPVPFLRTREFLWNEGHTVFATKEEAESEKDDIIGIYYTVLKDYMAIPGIIGKKSEKEKFAGAEYTVTIECLLPNGKAIQGPDFHHDGQIFAKAYNIQFLDRDGKLKYPYQNTWAITTRVIGIMVMMHSDDKGLVLPPRIAPNKIVIVPIKQETDKKVLKEAEKLMKELEEFSPILDSREEYSVGWKFNDWELKGIPLRIEIGPKDIEKNEVVVVRRDTGEKENVKISGLKKSIQKRLDEMHESMYSKAEKFLNNNIVKAKEWKEFSEQIKNKKMILAEWCGAADCEEEIKSESNGAKITNIPFEQPKKLGKCIHCGKEAKCIAYFAKSY